VASPIPLEAPVMTAITPPGYGLACGAL